MGNPIKKQTIADITLVLFSGALLCYMAFYNSFPLVYPDCGTYIFSGFTLKVPVDRPIFYGLFIRHVSLLTSLWLVVWVQGILLALVVYYWFRYFSGTNRFRFYYLLYISLITFLMSASVNVSQLIPDIFTPLGILSAGLLLFGARMKIRDQVISGLMVAISIMVHNSNLYILVMMLLVYTLLLLFRKMRESMGRFSLTAKRIAYMWGLVAVTYLAACSIQAGLGGGFTLSRGGHVFLMGKLVDSGILELYLRENCHKYHFKICQYEGKIPRNFIWDYKDSPLYKFGDGWTSPEVRQEYQAIFRDIFTTPRYAHLFAIKSIEGTFRQFFLFFAGEIPPQTKDSPTWLAVSQHFPVELRELTEAKEQFGSLDLIWLTNMQRYVFASALLLMVALLLYPEYSGDIRIVIWFILTGMIANAFICGTFSIVTERYQTRVVWLLPLPILLLMAQKTVFSGIVQKIFRH